MEKVHFNDEGSFKLFGKTYRWVIEDGRYTLKKVGK